LCFLFEEPLLLYFLFQNPGMKLIRKSPIFSINRIGNGLLFGHS
jgi:hypothetical protein